MFPYILISLYKAYSPIPIRAKNNRIWYTHRAIRSRVNIKLQYKQDSLSVTQCTLVYESKHIETRTCMESHVQILNFRTKEEVKKMKKKRIKRGEENYQIFLPFVRACIETKQ